MLDDYKAGIIATMPRSGTWYNHYFFDFYHQLLQGKTDLNAKVTSAPISAKDTIGLDFMLICHATCPGFHHYQGKHREAWDKLVFYVNGFNHAKDIIEHNIKFLDPFLNKDARIVYLYRNPLDQAISFFRHAQNHKDQQHRYRKDSQGNMVLMTNVKEYIHHVGLEAYIKQFLTYKIMKDMWPDNILMVTYKNLTRDPKATFMKILKHFGHDIDNPSRLEKLDIALALSSKDSMKNIENNIGYAFGDDQIDPKERHVRDGAIGKWKGYFNNDDLKSIEDKLNLFDLSLADFELK
jgi:hypothetical protein